MNNLVINIYDEKGKTVEKTVQGTTFDLMFGTVQKFMDLMNIENLENNLELLRLVHSAWSEIRLVLNEVFPELTEEEWKRVKIRELLPVIRDIAKAVLADFMSIPTDPKN